MTTLWLIRRPRRSGSFGFRDVRVRLASPVRTPAPRSWPAELGTVMELASAPRAERPDCSWHILKSRESKPVSLHDHRNLRQRIPASGSYRRASDRRRRPTDARPDSPAPFEGSCGESKSVPDQPPAKSSACQAAARLSKAAGRDRHLSGTCPRSREGYNSRSAARLDRPPALRAI